MSNATQSSPQNTGKKSRTMELVNKGLRRRYNAERRFRLYGMTAVFLSLLFMAFLIGNIVWEGKGAFLQTAIKLDIHLDPEMLPADDLQSADYGGLVKKTLREMFPEVKGRSAKRELYSIVSNGAAFQLRRDVLENPEIIGTAYSVWSPADDDVDMLIKGNIDRTLPESERRVSDRKLGYIESLEERGLLRVQFNRHFFTNGDSREPELAGIRGAVTGTALTLIVTLLLSFPVGVCAAVYLEEFAPTNRWTDLIEVNINNLAAVPSIVFGLLGLAVFLNFFELPRSAPLVGGLVLTLMTLPTIIIASRAALKTVPPSIRDAALSLGASRMETVLHHVLPMAMPGILTGVIIGMAQALGETAPLLMIGMVAFIVDVPTGFTDPATALPVQVFLWAENPERAFVEKTSAAIIVLLLFLICMNAAAVLLRKRFERRW